MIYFLAYKSHLLNFATNEQPYLTIYIILRKKIIFNSIIKIQFNSTIVMRTRKSRNIINKLHERIRTILNDYSSEFNELLER